MKVMRIGNGHYVLRGTTDGDGKPYEVLRYLTLPGGLWQVRDSRGRTVSEHARLSDAIGSV